MDHDADFTAACKGIQGPKLVKLPTGTLLFRFASSRRSGSLLETTEDDWYSGPWWFGKTEFDRVYKRGLGKNTGMSPQRDRSISREARNGFAVCNSWSAMDIIVKAQTRGMILAYAGPGLPQATSQQDQTQNTVMTPNQGINQLYLCDLATSGSLLGRVGFQRLNLSGE